MRVRSVVLTLCATLCSLTLAHATSAQPYYLALGDSLAVGYQPFGQTDTLGYADDLYAQLSTKIPGLKLEKLGCVGETASSMIQGGVCNYSSEGNQLDAAVDFLHTHKVALVTLDIGANDVDHCISATSLTIDNSCVHTGFESVSANLPYILRQLRRAAGPHTPIIGMNYYDPFLGAWVVPGGQTLALESLAATTDFNVILGAVYSSFHDPVANVAQAFHIHDFGLVPRIGEPVNVFLTLAWTWIGATPPDIHPNPAGYEEIADAFAKKIGLRG